MPSFDEHIKQANHNLKFLAAINNNISECWDWQVTSCFYTALHLVNAHLSQFNLQYRKHSDVNHAINFAAPLSPSKVPQDIYVAYMSLQSLSRRSRYLVNEKDENLKEKERAFYVFEKHLAKSFRHLEKIIKYFQEKYQFPLNCLPMKCSEIKEAHLFQYIKFH